MFDFLTTKFSSIFSKLTGSGTLTESNMRDTLQQISDALLQADVPYGLVQVFTKSIKEEVIGKKITSSLKPAEQLTKIVHDQMIHFFGGADGNTFTFKFPSVVMVMGLQGSGKTTSIAKFAYFINKSQTKKILVGSVDFYRPAAVEQLKIMAQKAKVDFYQAQNIKPIEAAQEIYAEFKQKNYDILFLDTAGRLHVDNTMLQELRDIDGLLNPQHKLLVLDSMTGQESLNVAKAFESGVGFDAAMLTKMDSDTRGGAAFSFRYALKKPIAFVGTGEKIENIEKFHPERVAGRMLDRGDLTTLVEKAEEKIKKSDQDAMFESFKKGSFTLNDFAKQMDMMNKLGSLSSLLKYMPGMGQQKMSQQDMDRGQAEMKKFRAIISSMTQKERLMPRIIDGSRKKRIARGSGVQAQDVNLLLSRFEQLKQYAKLMKRMGPLKNLFR